MEERNYIIVNPNAGKMAAKKIWPSIVRLLHDFKIDYINSFTEKRNHAKEITQKAISMGYRHFIVTGGDGTLNEVVNGMFAQNSIDPAEFTIAMIPVGTGNDWLRTHGMNSSVENSLKVINRKNLLTHDVGAVVYRNGKKRIKRFFINAAGLGFDAHVAGMVNRDKARFKGGRMLYVKNLLTSLFKFKSSDYSIQIDKKNIEQKVYSMSIGIGKYNGGGMMQMPNAIPDDGLFDITLIGDVSRLDVIRQAKNLFDGSFVRHPKITLHKGRRIKVETNSGVTIETDGESLGAGPFEFDIFPKALKVVVP